MKKNIWMIASLGLISLLVLSVCACDNTNQPLAYAENTDGTLTVTGMGHCSATEVVIPTEYNGKAITAIAENAFSGETDLQSLVIGNHITKIGQNCLSGCTALKSLTLPFVGATSSDTTTNYIGYLFGTERGKTASRSLETLTVLSAPRLDSYALCGLRSLKSFEFPADTTYIGDSCLEGCTALTAVSGITETITYVGARAFNATALTEITLNCPFEALQNDCLYGIENLATLTLDASADNDKNNSLLYLFDARLADEAFSACTTPGLMSTTSILPATLTTVHFMGTSVCSYALCSTKVTTLTFSDTIQSIGYGAFASCKSLTEVQLGEGVIALEDCAFAACAKLTAITLDANLNTIGDSAFMGCSSLTSMDFSACSSFTTIGANAFKNCVLLSELTLAESTTSLGIGAFYGCSALVDFTIPANVNNIGEDCFSNCKALASVTFIQPNGWKTVNGFIQPYLVDSAKNVVYLTDTYCLYRWYR